MKRRARLNDARASTRWKSLGPSLVAEYLEDDLRGAEKCYHWASLTQWVGTALPVRVAFLTVGGRRFHKYCSRYEGEKVGHPSSSSMVRCIHCLPL